MLVSKYNEFVRETDQFSDDSQDVRRAIATYGLVGELGSILSAIKKQLLTEGGIEDDAFGKPNEEIIEELGDVIWYCFSLAQIENEGRAVNLFIHNIARLRLELLAGDDRASQLRRVLDPTKRQRFLAASKKFPETKRMTFSHYQKLAILTARTSGQALLKVCLSVLWQLSAELLHKSLPDVERSLNKSFQDRKINHILADIAWHVAAITSVYRLTLDKVVETNVAKVSFRLKRGKPTILHDAKNKKSEQFPRRFEVSFITVGKGRSRMYLDGRQLGAELTDNAYEDDGYRFHDVMHLANVAKLGWSPVLRGLMRRKRKSNKKVDEVEDGARAIIVEEAIVKIIHSEGVRLAKQRGGEVIDKPLRIFPNNEEITFKFLKFIRGLVVGLEVAGNRYWEWEDAIIDGYAVFHELCEEGQGTVTVDLVARTLTYRPEVYIDLKGTVCGIGAAEVDVEGLMERKKRVPSWMALLTDSECAALPCNPEGAAMQAAHVLAVKRSVFEALGAVDALRPYYRMLDVKIIDPRRISLKATGKIQKEMWKRNVINFKTTTLQRHRGVSCTALAISDVGDS